MTTRTNKTTVFVYGTLMRGEGNHRLLEGARYLGPARTWPRFTLLHLGGFPGMTDGGATRVVGELYQVDAQTLAQLDRFEGVPTLYERKRVRLARGTAEAYVLARKRSCYDPKIPGGDWRTAPRRRQ